MTRRRCSDFRAVKWPDLARVAVALLLTFSLRAADDDRPWQRLQLPDVEAAYQAFRNPSPEYGLVMWWFWNGTMSEAEIAHDLEDMHAHGVKGVMVFPYYGTSVQYLSQTYFERIRFAVKEARRLDLRVWLMDEGSYPSGFAGGKVTLERPDLRMRILTAGERLAVHGGERVSTERGPDTLALVAVNQQTRQSQALNRGGSWTVPPGDWEVRTVRWEFRTSPTRHANRAGFFKDSMYSMFDPLDPAGSQFFIASVHEQYRKYIGDEFGRTVMGFMGDEPSVAGPPWTSRFLDEFRRRKGYDLLPYLPALVFEDLNDPRVRADYFDVWTDLYDENYFRPQTQWCAKNRMEYIVHLCGEEDTPTLVKLNGDYFKANRSVQIPGVDAIWRQIWPGNDEHYPKLASSSAHLRGRPRAFTESFAVYGQGLTLAQAKWVFDYQAVRGINHFQAMEYLSSTAGHRLYFHPPDWAAGPLWPYFPSFAAYVSRACSLLSLGRPAARLALYFPTTSGWSGDFGPDQAVRSIAKQLIENQRDFDFVDEDALRTGLRVQGAGLLNASGQAYQALIVPPVSFLTGQAMHTISTFAAAGGRVLFIGGPPRWIIESTYRDASAGASHPLFSGPRSSILVTPSLDKKALSYLPASDVELSPPVSEVKVLHRSLADADVFFFFNEGDRKIETSAKLEGKGDRAELWNAENGRRFGLASHRVAQHIQVNLVIEAHESAMIVLTSAKRTPEATPVSRFQTIAALDGDWSVTLGDMKFMSPLRTWSDLGMAAYFGTGAYRKRFLRPYIQPSSRIWLDLGEVRYAARVRLNGQDLGGRAWPPFRWEVTTALRDGEDDLEIEVANTRANEVADPASLASIEAKGWLRGSYITTYLKFDREMVPSGLLGPVRLLTSTP